MPKRIYVGNLPFSASQDEIRDMIGEAAIEGIQIKQEPGTKTAMASIVFEDDGPKGILAALNGRMVGGRKIIASDDRKVVINHEEQ